MSKVESENGKWNGVRQHAKRLLNAMREEQDRSGLQDARKAFESDMQPVVKAIVSALEDGDMEAMKGLRALLPHLLKEVNAAPALAEVLSAQLGRALVQGLTAKPQTSLLE